MTMMLGEFSMLQWTLMLAIGLIGGLVHGFVGIGMPLIATPLFAMLFGFQRAVPMLVIPTLVMVLCTFAAFGRSIDARDAFRRYWPLLITPPIGILLGTRALFVLPSRWLALMLAVVLILFLALDWRSGARSRTMQRHPAWFAVPFGLAAGFCEGTVNVAGPMLLIYFLLLDLQANAIITVMNVVFLLGKLVQSAALYQAGAFDAAVLQLALPYSLASAAMFVVGVRLRRRFDPSRYRGWLKATLWVMALLLLVRVLQPG